MSRIIGIDLGTTNCCGAYFDPYASTKEEQLTLFKDDDDNPLLPSILAVADDKIVVGRDARNMSGRIANVKREIGVSGAGRGPMGYYPISQIDHPTPIGISAEYLKAITARAEKALEEKITRAVVTVPAHFNHYQKIATREAGTLANLFVEELFPEPSAAALAYSWWYDLNNSTILVYDLGGGTFDATILNIRDKVCRIAGYGNGLAGESRLGGYDFDRHIAEHFIKYLKQKLQENRLFKGKRIELNANQQDAILRMAEDIKIQICQENGESREIFKPADILGEEFSVIEPLVVDLTIFKNLIEHEINRTVRECRNTYEECKAAKPDLKIDQIIMVGGSSRIPFIHEKLKEEFGIAPVLYEPDYCIAIGAAIYASSLGYVFESTDARIRLQEFPPKIGKSISINGHVKLNDEGAHQQVSDFRVILEDDTKAYSENVSIRENGLFKFKNVPVDAKEGSHYLIALQTPDGEQAVRGTFMLSQGERLKPELPRTSQPFKIKTIEGLIELLPAGTQLGTVAMKKFYTSDETKEIRIPAYEGFYPLGELVIPLDDRISPGIPIEVSVGYDRKNHIIMSALSPEHGIGKSDLEMHLQEIYEGQGLKSENLDLREEYSLIMKEIYEQLEAVSEEDQERIKPEVEFLGKVIDHELNAQLERHKDSNRIADCFVRLEMIRTFLAIPKPNIDNAELMVDVLRINLTRVKARKDVSKISNIIEKIDQDISTFEQNIKAACERNDIIQYTDAQKEFRVILAQLQELQPDIDMSPEYFRRLQDESMRYMKDAIRYFEDVQSDPLPDIKDYDLWISHSINLDNAKLKEYFEDLKDAISKFYAIKNSPENEQAKSGNLQILLVSKIIPMHKGIVHEIDQKGLLKS